jgi:hypothetical protein
LTVSVKQKKELAGTLTFADGEKAAVLRPDPEARAVVVEAIVVGDEQVPEELNAYVNVTFAVPPKPSVQ